MLKTVKIQNIAISIYHMTTTPDAIQNLLKEKLPGCHAHVETYDMIHFEATITYSGFANKSLLQQHRMVYEALGDKMETEIHALELNTQVPKE